MNKLVILSLLCFQCIKGFSGDIAALTFPKSGTHIILKLMSSSEFGNHYATDNFSNFVTAENSYLSIHFQDKDLNDPNCPLFHDPKYKFLLNIRDLRDVCISMVNWYTEINVPPFYTNGVVDHNDWFKLSFNDKLKDFFQPELWGKSVILYQAECFRKIYPLLPADRTLTITFEKLVGPKGGGNQSDQKNEIKKIVEFLQIDLSDEKIITTCQDLYGGTFTFRKGQIGTWKEYFDGETLSLFDFYLGDLQNFFGYE